MDVLQWMASLRKDGGDLGRTDGIVSTIHRIVSKSYATLMKMLSVANFWTNRS